MIRQRIYLATGLYSANLLLGRLVCGQFVVSLLLGGCRWKVSLWLVCCLVDVGGRLVFGQFVAQWVSVEGQSVVSLLLGRFRWKFSQWSVCCLVSVGGSLVSVQFVALWVFLGRLVNCQFVAKWVSVEVQSVVSLLLSWFRLKVFCLFGYSLDSWRFVVRRFG